MVIRRKKHFSFVAVIRPGAYITCFRLPAVLNKLRKKRPIMADVKKWRIPLTVNSLYIKLIILFTNDYELMKYGFKEMLFQPQKRINVFLSTWKDVWNIESN